MATNAELAMFKLAKRIAPDPGRGVHHDAARPDEPARGYRKAGSLWTSS
ncbi:hypothetical protein [Pseudarthrobacter sp.]